MKRIVFLIVLTVCLSGSNLFAGSYDEIIRTGVLKVAAREMPVNYVMENGKIVPGFTYEIASEFAKHIGVKLEVTKVNKFKDFWLKDGQMILKMAPPVTPDIFQAVDMTFDITSVNSKREQYIDMIPYIGNKSVIFSHKDAKIKSIKDLIGKKIYLHEHMQSFDLVKNLLAANHIESVIHRCKYSQTEGKLVYENDFHPSPEKVNIVLKDKESKTPDMFGYLVVYRKFADAAATDSFTLFLKFSEHGYLRSQIVASFPLEKEMGYLSATLPKNNTRLKEQFEKFISQSRENGFLNQLVQKYLTIDLDTYYNLLKYREN